MKLFYNINFFSMKKLLLICCCFCLTNLGFAQKPPIKWGKVDEADLNMLSYPSDPEAEAVVLMDYASIDFTFEGSSEYVMRHHVRIKILKESAFDRGDIDIEYYAHNKLEEIKDLKAQVILPNGEKIKLNKKDIFTEKINNYWSRKKFAMPSLKRGAIIEYFYTKQSESITNLAEWYFQRDIPTRHSELRTNIPEWFDYISFTQGRPPVVKSDVVNQNIRFNNRNSAYKTEGGMMEARITKTQYIVENIPAMKSEQFITTMRDYYSKITLQLKTIQFPNSIRRGVNSDWPTIAENLDDNDSFGKQINKPRNTKKIMEAVGPLLAKTDQPLEKLMLAYSFLNSTITWNESYGIFARKSLDDAFVNKQATAGELNLMLIAICRQLGLTAYPVLISTRSHGKMFELYPKTDQFNHVLAYVTVGDKEALLDVGSPHRAPNYLRVNSLNYQGWLMDGPQSQWINIAVPADVEKMVVNADLSAEGTLTGTVQEICTGYSAMVNRNEYYQNMEKDNEHIVKNWQEVFPDAKVTKIDFTNPEKTSESLKSSMDIHLPNAAQINDDFIYLSPMLGKGYDENPLKLENRTFPVDMPYQVKEQYVLNVTIPAGYTVEELPEPTQVKMPEGAGVFRFSVSETDGKVQITSKIFIKKNRYVPEEYQGIRQFFDHIVEKHGEQIVLKKMP